MMIMQLFRNNGIRDDIFYKQSKRKVITEQMARTFAKQAFIGLRMHHITDHREMTADDIHVSFKDGVGRVYNNLRELGTIEISQWS